MTSRLNGMRSPGHLSRAVATVCVLWMSGTGLAPGQDISFDRDIRPILASRCFQCHGPDAARREAELRLDVRDDVFADRGGYAVAIPGEPDRSELYRRVSAEDESEVMPPPDSKLSLSAAERNLLRRWIEQGAEWDQHWSFVPPVRPEPPQVHHTDHVNNPIDAFIVSRLEQEGLAPSPPADRATLIRRATLDLTGVPPTWEETAAFLNDSSPDAWERVVDRLLASPRYGQRMAWEWLDAARYADTDGFQGDPTRSMWPWRDWLVDALNRNMPFDQFTIAMLAGDLVPGTTDEQILATGFHRNHMYNGEGGRIAEETRVENVFDRTETTATVWLGLTMTCARCHDHKFDPISQAEYYRLYAYFNNTSESGTGNTRGQAPPSRPYVTPEQRTRLAEVDTELARLTAQMTAPDPALDEKQQQWEDALLPRIVAFQSGTDTSRMSAWQQSGPVAVAESAAGDTAIASVLQVRSPEAPLPLLHADMPWIPHADYPDGQVNALPNTIGVTWLTRLIDAPSQRTMELSLGSDDNITVWLNDGPPLLNRQIQRAAEPDQDALTLNLVQGPNRLLMKIENTGGIAGFYFRRVSESVAGITQAMAAIVSLPREQRTPQQQTALTEYFRAQHSDEWRALADRRAELTASRETIRGRSPVVMVMDDLPPERRRETRVLERGTYNKPTDVLVEPGTPAVLHPAASGKADDRLELAHWIMAPENPLTARVTVNRFWQLFFGRGLVSTTEDFGQTGDRPSHPDLLDWLAVEFRDNGWDVKALHRTIVTSATYCRSSSHLDAAGVAFPGADRDPENHLYWRSPRFRLPSWMLRDQALAVGGLLNEALNGPPVRPYQPDGLWAEATFGQIRYQPDTGPALYRRSLYVFWRRIVGPPQFFDAAKRQTCEVRATRTNTPLHALTTLNETAFVESARGFAQRVLTSEAQTVADRIDFAVRSALSRPARPAEQAVLEERLQLLRNEYEQHPDEAHALLAVGESPRDESLSAAEHAAWTVVCSTIMNLDEFLSHE